MQGGMAVNSYSSKNGATFSQEDIYPETTSGDEKPFSSFAELFREKQKVLGEAYGRKITKEEIGLMLGFDYESFRKIVNKHKEKQTKKRDCIIAICAVLGCDASETNEALRLYGFPELDQYHLRDEIIWDKLVEQSDSPVSVDEINEALTAACFTPLDISNHRNQSQPKIKSCPYKLVRRHFQCTIEGVGRCREPDCFLDLRYDVDCFYNMRTCMEYLGQDRRFEICIRYEESRKNEPDNIYQTGILRRISPKRKRYIVYTYPTEECESELHEYDRIDETGEFRDCFLEIEKAEQKEKKRLCDTVNDTRNYGSRISAKVIDSELHIFCETYNCDIPELSEYFLMDFCGGDYTLYILNQSCFMQMYLSEEQYEQAYGSPPAFRILHLRRTWDDAWGSKAGKLNDPVSDQYSCEEEIEDSAYEARDIGIFETYGENVITEVRLKAYKAMKQQIDHLTGRLRTGKAHICSRELLGDAADSLIAAYFGLPELDDIAYTFSDGTQLMLSAENIRDAFELGMHTVDEAAAFQQVHGSLKINEILP